jgi:hypothetical protein
MNVLWKALSTAALGLTVVPSILVFTGAISWSMHATLMMVGTVAWFATAPLWMEGTRAQRKHSDTHETDF